MLLLDIFEIAIYLGSIQLTDCDARASQALL
jgi:hypothetical protein